MIIQYPPGIAAEAEALSPDLAKPEFRAGAKAHLDVPRGPRSTELPGFLRNKNDEAALLRASVWSARN